MDRNITELIMSRCLPPLLQSLMKASLKRIANISIWESEAQVRSFPFQWLSEINPI